MKCCLNAYKKASETSRANHICALGCGQDSKAVIRPTRSSSTHLVPRKSMWWLPRLFCWQPGSKQKFKSLRSTRQEKRN